MVVNIVPVGNGQADEKGRRYAIVFYVMGSVAGGILLGYILTSLGAVVQHAWQFHFSARYLSVLVGAFFLLASVREVEILKFYVPQSGSQVPRSWFYSLGYHAGAFAWGGYLSLGFLTPVVSVGFYAIVLGIILVAGRTSGLFLALAYVTGRMMPVIGIRYMVSRSGRGTSWHIRQIAPFSSAVLVSNGVLLMSLGSLFLTATFYR
jgi:MFS family permease